MPDLPQLPEGSVVITPTEMYREMQDIGRKVDHLTSVLDPWQNEVRRDVAANRERIEQIRTERIEQVAALDTRVHVLETSGYVTSARMWAALTALAVIIAAITGVAVAVFR